jgi:hypothetical protein
MKLKYNNLTFDVHLAICEGGIQVTMPVDTATEDVFGLGLNETPNFLIRRFVATDKRQALDLISNVIDELYEKA